MPVLLFEYQQQLLSVYQFIANMSLYNIIVQGYGSNAKCNCDLHVQGADSKIPYIL